MPPVPEEPHFYDEDMMESHFDSSANLFDLLPENEEVDGNVRQHLARKRDLKSSYKAKLSLDKLIADRERKSL